MHRRFSKQLALTLSLMVFMCSCSNVFRGMSRQDSDEALYEDALKAMNSSDWDSAITKFQTLSATFLAQRTVRENYAGALAGKCGLIFMDYLNTISSSSPGGSVTTFQWLMNAFTQKIVNPSSCVLAETQIRSLGATPALRTTGQNLFLVILSLVKIGTTLRNRADIDSTNSLGDGTTDASFNACTASPSAADVLTDAEIREVITGLALAIENSASLPSGAGIGTSLGTLGGVCGATCNKTDSSAVNASDITTIRNLLATTANTIGVGGQCPTTIPAACCP